MEQYCVNKNAQSTGEHEVHNLNNNCSYLPDPQNRLDLGSFGTCHQALTKAEETYDNVDGCAYCAIHCHTK